MGGDQTGDETRIGGEMRKETRGGAVRTCKPRFSALRLGLGLGFGFGAHLQAALLCTEARDLLLQTCTVVEERVTLALQHARRLVHHLQPRRPGGTLVDELLLERGHSTATTHRAAARL
jgi:hypothetical protein